MANKRSPTAVSVEELGTALRPVLKPIVKPVVDRLDRLEEAVVEIRGLLDVQFKRTAQIQAQLDRLLAEIAQRKS